MADVLAVRDEYRAQNWAMLIQECNNSGLTKREFCQQRGIVRFLLFRPCASKTYFKKYLPAGLTQEEGRCRYFVYTRRTWKRDEVAPVRLSQKPAQNRHGI